MLFACDSEPPSGHTFREHNKKADLWADKGAKGRVEGWVGTTRIARPGDWSCDNGIVIMAFSDLHGWSACYKKCGPLPGVNSVDAELGECGMLVEKLRRWIDKCVRQTGE